jgi:hypothetical protein
MPVTAKLSRAFYDRLGDTIANELVEWFNQVDATYRGDLRQLNELNFARFDASVGERFAVSELRFAELERRMDERMTAFETRFDDRMTAFEARFDDRMTAFEARTDARFSELELTLHRRLDVLQWRMFGLLAVQFALIAGLYLK